MSRGATLKSTPACLTGKLLTPGSGPVDRLAVASHLPVRKIMKTPKALSPPLEVVAVRKAMLYLPEDGVPPRLVEVTIERAIRH